MYVSLYEDVLFKRCIMVVSRAFLYNYVSGYFRVLVYPIMWTYMIDIRRDFSSMCSHLRTRSVKTRLIFIQ